MSMRKWEKQAVLDICNSLIDAHRQAEKYAKSGNASACYEILSACQDGAVSIGNKIEVTEGKGTEAVSVLENYCEALYQSGQKLGDYDKDRIRRAFSELNNQITEVRQLVSDDIDLRYEVVLEKQ